MLESKLSAFASVPISHGTLISLLLDYRRPNDKIADWLAKGVLIPLRRGLYLVGAEWRRGSIALPLIANHLYGPSCVSLDYALAWHGMIPEHVVEVTSVAARRSRMIENPIGRFSYSTVPVKLYNVGMMIESSAEGVSFLMAGPEKALCDKVLLTRHLNVSGLTAMQRFLFDDLRIDPDTLSRVDLSLIEVYAVSGFKPRQFHTLLRVLERLQ